MATINYTVEHNVAAGYVKVEWPNMAGGDVGQPFDCGGLKLGSLQYFGDFNGGQGSFQASDEVAASTFVTVNDKTQPAFESPEANDFPAYYGAVRTAFAGSGGDITIAAIFIAPR